MHFPIPNTGIQDCIDTLGGNSFFSVHWIWLRVIGKFKSMKEIDTKLDLPPKMAYMNMIDNHLDNAIVQPLSVESFKKFEEV